MFKSFDKIEQIGKLYMTITQKLHGTNAQIFIQETVNLQDEPVHVVMAGSRNRWLTPEDDNYGFAKFVDANRDEIIKKLGVGRHYGEWCGPGINAGEGLEEQTFFLFDWSKFKDKDLPPQIKIIPLLHSGKFNFADIELIMQRLKIHGSYAKIGYMKPEGIVIQIGSLRFKRVFDTKDVGWTKGDFTPVTKLPRPSKYRHLLDITRLENLLSKDERYRREFPENMRELFALYLADACNDNSFTEEEQKEIKKDLSRSLFNFIKENIYARVESGDEGC